MRAVEDDSAMAYFEDLQVSGIVDAQQLTAHVVIVLKNVQLLNVAADPTIAPGVSAPLGSLALLAGSGIWQKTGALDTNWTALVGGGGIVGPGTINTVSKFTAANAVADSQITDDGAAVAVNAASTVDINAATNATVNASDTLSLVGAGAAPGVEIDATASNVNIGSITGVNIAANGPADPVGFHGGGPVVQGNITGGRADAGAASGALGQLLTFLASRGDILNNSTGPA